MAILASLNATGSTVVIGETWVLTLISGAGVSTYSFKATDALLQTVLDGLAALVNADAASLLVADAGGG